MNKQDFQEDERAQAIADTFVEEYHKVAIAKSIAEALEANNDNFDRAVFLAKCGVKI